MSYNPLTYEKNWEISTAEKGTRYSVIRGDTGGDVACVPYGLTCDCKALATMISATPDLLQVVMEMLEVWDSGSSAFPIAKARAALAKATLKS